jgi:hypothetical protein
MWEHTESPLYDLVQIMYGAVEHLVELRHRIFVVMATDARRRDCHGLLCGPHPALPPDAGRRRPLHLPAPTDMIWVRMEIIFSAALVLALPVLLYQILMFIRPALENPQEIASFDGRNHRRAAGAALFHRGIVFAYYVLLPVMLALPAGHRRRHCAANLGHSALLLVRAGRPPVDRRVLRDAADHGPVAGWASSRRSRWRSSGVMPSSASPSSPRPSRRPWTRLTWHWSWCRCSASTSGRAHGARSVPAAAVVWRRDANLNKECSFQCRSCVF